MSPKPKNNSQEENQQRREDPQNDELKKNQANNKKDKPKDGKPDEKPADQEKGRKPPPPKDPEKVERNDLSGRWGILPPKIQNDILNFNIENFPQKYRKWLEEYYRRINQQKQR